MNINLSFRWKIVVFLVKLQGGHCDSNVGSISCRICAGAGTFSSTSSSVFRFLLALQCPPVRSPNSRFRSGRHLLGAGQLTCFFGYSCFLGIFFVFFSIFEYFMLRKEGFPVPKAQLFYFFSLNKDAHLAFWREPSGFCVIFLRFLL